MSPAMLSLRSVVAGLLVVLGLTIFGRGVLEGDPLTYTAMGALMAGLGAYRLRLMSGRWGQR